MLIIEMTMYYVGHLVYSYFPNGLVGGGGVDWRASSASSMVAHVHSHRAW